MSKPNHPHPGELLREEVIEALDLSVSQAAKAFGMSRPALCRVLNGRAAISSDLAIRLEMAGISTARFWVTLQIEYDLEQSRQNKQPDIPRLMPERSFA